MLKYVTKFTMDILPSVIATIIGAYIVNHYIANKPAADAPVAAAVSTSDPKAEAKMVTDGKAPESSSDIANIPEAGVKAKGISEKAVFDRAGIERIIEQPSEKAAEKTVDKPAEKPAESASTTDTRRHPAPAREKTAVAKTAPAAMPAPVAAIAPAAAPVAAPSVEAAVTPEEHQDANDLARAAIERLRGSNDPAPRPQEAARVAEPPRVASAPPAIRPLPPPIMVSTPPSEALDPAAAPAPVKPPYADASRVYDPNRPTPPADIPTSRAPLDLRADATLPAPRDHTNVAEDMLSAAKSVFHAVLPK